jgi:hypothetical protein
MDTTTAHRIRWYVWGHNPGTGERYKLRHTAKMRGLWGWDAECTCGWETRTGGATRTYVKDQVWLHKFFATPDENSAS